VKSTGHEPDPAFDRLVARGLARELDASGNACPDADLLAAWFDHTLSALESERIEAHSAGCDCCQQILASLARSEPPVIRAAPLPEPARAWHWHWRWAVPLATAVLVLVVGSHTLRAPAPSLRPSGSGEAGSSLRPSGFGEAGQQPVQIAADKKPAPVAMNQAAPPAAEVDARPRTATPGSGLRPSGSGEAGGRIAKAEPAPAVAPTAGAAPSAMKPESRMAEQVQRQADAASDKILKAAAPMPPPPPPPPAPRAEAKVAVAGGAPQGFNSPSVRQASVTTSMLSGSAVSWRFGTSGAIEKSSDRGQTWVRQSSGVTTALSDASAPGDRICWIVGEAGVVLRTTDGVTWQRLTSPTDANLVAVHAWNELAATVTASDRSEYETTDGGKTWKRR
jgi:hypothetical protein